MRIWVAALSIGSMNARSITSGDIVSYSRDGWCYGVLMLLKRSNEGYLTASMLVSVIVGAI